MTKLYALRYKNKAINALNNCRARNRIEEIIVSFIGVVKIRKDGKK